MLICGAATALSEMEGGREVGAHAGDASMFRYGVFSDQPESYSNAKGLVPPRGKHEADASTVELINDQLLSR